MNYFQIVKDVIDSWDPEGFFPQAPEDEYEIAVMEIAPSIVTAGSVDEMTFIIHRGMNATFGDYHYSECRPSAKRIWDKIHSTNDKKRTLSFVVNQSASNNLS